MSFDRLIAALSRPSAWPERPGEVVVLQTHASVVFLVGSYAYKVKKPVDLGFLDFSTPERREHFCREEVRLNRHYSEGVYLGVVRLQAAGQAEWAVKMRRMADELTFKARLHRDALDEATVRRFGGYLAERHASATRSPEIARYGRLEVVAGNARENFEQTRPQVGRFVHEDVWQRLRRLTEQALQRLGALVEARADAGRPCDTHGDLRLEHVYLEDGRFQILDCIEFNERFRYADPVSDVAFLAMDLDCRGRRDLARALVEAWVQGTSDAQAHELLPLYAAYRSVVRAKVAGLQLLERDDEALAGRARMHWLYALAELEPPERRPCVVGVGGLPGVGKSTLARGLAEAASFQVIRSDVVRKELAGVPVHASAAEGYGEGLYGPAQRDRVYQECLHRAEAVVARGGRALVDASFSREAWRHDLLDLARRLGVRARLLWAEAPTEVVRERLAARSGDASDADVAIHERAARDWEAEGERVKRYLARIPTSGPAETAVEAAVEALRGARLAARSR